MSTITMQRPDDPVLVMEGKKGAEACRERWRRHESISVVLLFVSKEGHFSAVCQLSRMCMCICACVSVALCLLPHTLTQSGRPIDRTCPEVRTFVDQKAKGKKHSYSTVQFARKSE